MQIPLARTVSIRCVGHGLLSRVSRQFGSTWLVCSTPARNSALFVTTMPKSFTKDGTSTEFEAADVKYAFSEWEFLRPINQSSGIRNNYSPNDRR